MKLLRRVGVMGLDSDAYEIEFVFVDDTDGTAHVVYNRQFEKGISPNETVDILKRMIARIEEIK